jgi:hypothetical protein
MACAASSQAIDSITDLQLHLVVEAEDVMNSGSTACIRNSVLLALLGVLAGCGHVVALHDVQALESWPIPDYRRVDVQSSIVHSSDIISLSVKSANGEVCRLSIKTSCKTPGNACQGLKLPYLMDEKISRDGVNPRITAFTLEMVRNVEVGTVDQSQACNAKQVIDFSELVGNKWEDAKQEIEAAWKLGPTTLHLARAVRPDQRAFPGDRVTVVAEHLAQGKYFSFQSSLERVDRWGELSIPQLTLPARRLGAGGAAPHQFFGQLIMQQEARFRAKVTVWKPGEKQPTISHIERCLALRWDEAIDMGQVPVDLVNEVESCLSLGIHSYTATDENQFVRFRLDLHQEWSIVLTDGRRFEQLLVPGESLADAVRRAVRELTGHDGLRPTYAVVDPRPELRERPFTSILSQRRGLLDNVLLISGDVVHLSNFAPVHME